MTTYLSDHNKAGFEHWAKLNNLKEAARTFNYLSEHNLLNYEDFKNHVADSADAIQATESKIQSLNKQLDAQRLLQKRCDVYRHCRTVLLAEKDAPDKKAYQKQHQAEYQLHDTTLQELSGLGIKKTALTGKIAEAASATGNRTGSYPERTHTASGRSANSAYCTKQLFLYAPGC